MTSVLVLGAGVAGLAAALPLRRAGLEVTVVDPLPPGSGGASFGNAGMISAAIVAPSSLPGMWRQVPRWLLDPMGPLAIRPGRLPGAMPWLLRWLEAGRRRRVMVISPALHILMRDAFAEWRALAGPAMTEALLRESGQVLASESPPSPAQAALDRALREMAGIATQRLDRPALEGLFPGLAPSVRGGLLLPGNGYCRDPQRLVASLAETFLAEGGILLPESAQKLLPENGGWMVMTNRGNHRASALVVAAGAWSGRLLAPLGLSLPLEAERGYHAMLPDPSLSLPMPISVRSRGVGLAPMAEGLRAAGTVEIAGLDAPPDEQRALRLADQARALFPDLRHGAPRLWMGPRPGTPDSLPLVGAVARFPGLFLCCGHGHLGLTSSPATGRLLAALVTGGPAPFDPLPYAPGRFRL